MGFQPVFCLKPHESRIFTLSAQARKHIASAAGRAQLPADPIWRNGDASTAPVSFPKSTRAPRRQRGLIDQARPGALHGVKPWRRSGVLISIKRARRSRFPRPSPRARDSSTRSSIIRGSGEMGRLGSVQPARCPIRAPNLSTRGAAEDALLDPGAGAIRTQIRVWIRWIRLCDTPGTGSRALLPERWTEREY
jgi:hypothetical protein